LKESSDGETLIAVGICLLINVHARLLLRTQEICFGRKTNETAKFNTLDQKMKFTILDEIWTKMAN